MATPRRRAGLLVVAAAAAAAVFAGSAASPSFERTAPPDPCFAAEPARCFVSHGAWIVLDGAVAPERAAVERALGRALAYWAAPPDALAGWLVTYEDREVDCNGDRASGCASWRRGTLRLQVLDPACPETAQLVHEVGHVVLHDAGHRDARWCRDAEQEEIRALVRGPGASPGCARSRHYTGAPAAPSACEPPARRSR